jgi:hypothetical protein
MSFNADDIQANRDYFVRKLHAEKQRSDVVKAAESGSFDFLLLDARGREAFANGHITGAWCVSPAMSSISLRSGCPTTKRSSPIAGVMIDCCPPRRLCSWQSAGCS